MDIMPGLQGMQNVHPLFVHFPIAFILATVLFETLWWVTKREDFRTVATYLLYLSAISAIAGVVSGLLASNSLGHDAPGHDYVHGHRNMMYWATGLLLATSGTVAIIQPIRLARSRKLLIVPLLLISGLMVAGADLGGRLVFEFGMGVKATTKPAVQEAERQLQQEEKKPAAPVEHQHEEDCDAAHKH